MIAPLLAVAPVALDLDGGWIALHLVGGAVSLGLLIYFGWQLPSPWRWWAAGGVAISIAVISVVTGGGSLGAAVQIALLIVIGAIYVTVVFRPRQGS